MAEDKYIPPAYVTKRLRYFDGQFLKDQDFIDEQHYFLDRQRRYSRFLNVAGLVDGLTVSTRGTAQVIVAPGTALDAQGRQLVLGHERSVPLDAYKGKTVELVIAYREEGADQAQVDAGSAGFTRLHENPYVEPKDRLPADVKDPITLAKLTIDANGVVSVDSTVRAYAGWRLPYDGAAPGQGPTLRAGAAGRLDLIGTLSVTGNVGIGRADPTSALHVGLGKSVRFELGSSHKLSLGGNGAFEVDAPDRPGGRFLVTQDGKVGIGTPAPGAFKLKVEGGATSLGGALTVTGATTLQDTLTVTKAAALQDTLTVAKATALQDTLTVTGNVGIGTTSPATTLHLYTTGYTQATAETTSTFAVYRLMSGSRTYQLSTAGNDIGAPYTGALYIHDETAGATRLLITSNGNVGIGTTNPGAFKLKVEGGDTSLVGALTVNGATALQNTLTVTGGDQPLTVRNNDFFFFVGVDREKGGYVDIGAYHATAGWKTLVLNRGGGNVGIGTTNPGAKLEVKGGLTILEQPQWTAVVLQGGWKKESDDVSPAGYFKDSQGIVHLRGVIKDGPSYRVEQGYPPGTFTIFTLPEGYRPQHRQMHAVGSLGVQCTLGTVNVHPSGHVELIIGHSESVSLDGISFRAV